MVGRAASIPKPSQQRITNSISASPGRALDEDPISWRCVLSRGYR
jgi:hypothetical protein